MIASRRHLLKSAGLGAAVMCAPAILAAQPAADEVAPDEHAAMRAKAEAFCRENQIPGLSVAIARAGQMVYARGFGIADEGFPVQPYHLLRIASVSKPITAVALFTLIDQGRLRLSDRIFGPGGILEAEHRGRRRISPVEEITVEQLMTHTAGGWPNDARDPMFVSPQMTHHQLITWTLDNIPLVTAPGTTHAYSNFGYCLLGRVIEKVSGQPYETFVRSAVLQRCGITTMQIAGNTRSERVRNEVAYYPDGNPYGMNVRRMDAHGGWIASASDLARFASCVDGFSAERNILRQDSIKTMTAPPAVNRGYALGWSVNAGRNYWHNGSLPGTSAIMVRTQSGFCWGALANARHGDSVGALDRLMWSMVRGVKRWQA